SVRALAGGQHTLTTGRHEPREGRLSCGDLWEPGAEMPRATRLRAQPAVRDELLRLTLKSNSNIEHTPDGGLMIRLYVDRWEWLIPLVSSYGGDVLVEEPAELRDAIVAQLRRALDAYEDAARIALEAVAAGFRNDDSRVRSTRGRTPTET
ncbi:MAG: WYL domain-containing protein, partial [Pseudonocardiaceae bacterium]